MKVKVTIILLILWIHYSYLGLFFPHNIFSIVNLMFILFSNLFLHKPIKWNV